MGILCCLLLMTIAYIQLLFATNNSHSQTIIAEDHYGEQITQITANKIRQAAASGDLISLQAELNEITQSRHIITAIIYDIDNVIKVQSGTPIDHLSRGESHLTFSAPITQDENIIGQLSIIIERTQRYSYISLLSALLFLLSLVFLIFCFYKALANTEEKIVVKDIQDTTTNNEKNNETTIILLLQFKNIDTIFKQLSKEIREDKYQKISATIKNVLKIYNAEIKATDANNLFITLSNSDKEQAILNTTCCAGLLQKIANVDRWFIKTNTVIYETSNNIDNISALTALQYLRTQAEDSIFIHQTLATIASTRISTQTLNKKALHFLEIKGFSEQYQNLLKNQCKHLIRE